MAWATIFGTFQTVAETLQTSDILHNYSGSFCNPSDGLLTARETYTQLSKYMVDMKSNKDRFKRSVNAPSPVNLATNASIDSFVR
jgi:hypothetical protein